MSGKLENVKVGDKLIVHAQFFKEVEVVERTTATLVITKYHRFNYRRNLISKCKSIEFNKLSDFQLEAIIKIANNHG